MSTTRSAGKSKHGRAKMTMSSQTHDTVDVVTDRAVLNRPALEDVDKYVSKLLLREAVMGCEQRMEQRRFQSDQLQTK